jgi:hypothetical protein
MHETLQLQDEHIYRPDRHPAPSRKGPELLQSKAILHLLNRLTGLTASTHRQEHLLHSHAHAQCMHYTVHVYMHSELAVHST